MPVGSRSIVCRSKSASSLRRSVSPAPPSKSTLSGRTTAARPLMSRIVMMCWRKLSCLLDVVTTKSWRSISRSSRTSRPSAPTIVSDDLRPNGGLDSTTDQRWPGSAMRASVTSMSESPFGGADAVQQQVHRGQPGGAVDQLVAARRSSSRRWSRSVGVSDSAPSRRRARGRRAGSRRCRRPGRRRCRPRSGWMTSTIAWISVARREVLPGAGALVRRRPWTAAPRRRRP